MTVAKRVVLGFAALLALLLLRVLRPRQPVPLPASPVTEAPETVPAQAPPLALDLEAADSAGPDRPVADRTRGLVGEIEQALGSGDDAAQRRGIERLVTELLSRDAAVAATVAQSWEPGAVRDELLRRLAQAWVALDAPSAIEWVARLPDPAERQRIAAELSFQLARDDPADAVRVAELLGVGVENGDFGALVQRWAERDLPGALGWVTAQPPGPTRDRLLARVAVVQAQAQPAQAANLVQMHVAPGAVRNEALAAVLQQWAAQDPFGAAGWAATVADPELRAHIREELDRLQGEANAEQSTE